MKVQTVEEMRERDRNALLIQGRTLLELIEEAAEAILEVLVQQLIPHPEHHRIFVFCGKGNNGGDGLALALRLRRLGAKVKVALIHPLEDCNQEVKILATSLKDVLFLQSEASDDVFRWLEESDWVIDALLGTGVKHPVEDPVKKWIRILNESGKPVISLDLPSGIHGNSGQPQGIAVRAKATIVIDRWKTGNFLGESCDWSGSLYKTRELDLWEDPHPIYEKRAWSSNPYPLETRKESAHKYDFGKLTVVGGSRGMEGAPVLAALAGLRTGCGLASVLRPGESLPVGYPPFLELMMDSFSTAVELENGLEKTRAVVFGPGTVYREQDEEFLRKILKMDRPVVLDGGGISLLNGLRDRVPMERHRVIATPHIGELARLFRVPGKDVLDDPIYYATSFLETYGVDLVLKGPCTIVGTRQKLDFFYQPNSAMATAGSGDVLAGLIGGFLAQGAENLQAMIWGVLTHQIAGKKGAQVYGKRSMTATDLLSFIHEGIKDLERREGMDEI